MRWHLDRFGEKNAEVRVLDHALYVMRDGLKTVSGMDESGHMDAMGLGWVGMLAKDDRPFIPQEVGGLQGSSATSPSPPYETRRCSSPSTSSISARRSAWVSSPTRCSRRSLRGSVGWTLLGRVAFARRPSMA